MSLSIVAEAASAAPVEYGLAVASIVAPFARSAFRAGYKTASLVDGVVRPYA
jgi:hypothetical protein